MTASVTITVPGGKLVFIGSRPDGGSRWSFLRRQQDGTFAPARVPSKWRRFMRPRKEQHERKSRA